MDAQVLERLKNEGKIKVNVFTDRAKLLELAEPVKVAFAKEIGAEKVLADINAVK
jgi:hypothetical protein